MEYPSLSTRHPDSPHPLSIPSVTFNSNQQLTHADAENHSARNKNDNQITPSLDRLTNEGNRAHSEIDSQKNS